MLQAVDDLSLALRAEGDGPFLALEVADLQRQAGAAVQQGQQLAIDGVDAAAQCQQFGVRSGSVTTGSERDDA